MNARATALRALLATHPKLAVWCATGGAAVIGRMAAIARDYARMGYEKVSSRHLWEACRHEGMSAYAPTDERMLVFRLNNNLLPLAVRAMQIAHPDIAGMIETRERRS